MGGGKAGPPIGGDDDLCGFVRTHLQAFQEAGVPAILEDDRERSHLFHQAHFL